MSHKVEYLCNENMVSYDTLIEAQSVCDPANVQKIYICLICDEEYEQLPKKKDDCRNVCCHKMIPVKHPLTDQRRQYDKKPKKEPRVYDKPKSAPELFVGTDRAAPGSKDKSVRVTVAKTDDGNYEIKDVEILKDPDPNCPECGTAQKFGKVTKCRCMKR